MMTWALSVGSTSGQFLGSARLHAEVLGADRTFAHDAVHQLRYPGGPHGTDLVHSRLPVHDQRMGMAQLLKGPDHERHQGRIGHAHQLPSDAGRVGERPEDVHHGGEAELPAHRPHVPHCRMKKGGEHEDESDLLEHGGHLFRGELDANTERLEHVGASTPGRERAIPVLGDSNPRTAGDQRGRRGDVERGLRPRPPFRRCR